MIGFEEGKLVVFDFVIGLSPEERQQAIGVFESG